MTLQGPIETIRAVIEQTGPATDRQIETHPQVVAACRSSKTKARRHIDRLVTLGAVRSDGAVQGRKLWVVQ
jgi:predicted HTH transcriptional regulator